MEEILYLLNPWWENKKFATGILRDKYLSRIKINLSNKRAVLLIGSRRVGKTTLLYQAIDFLLKKEKVNQKHICYILVDHPKFIGLKIGEIIREFRAIHNLNRTTKIYLFFDEVQYGGNWQQEVKAILDTENAKVFLSGSASALIAQKSSFLTGRYTKIKVEPLDFKEFLDFKKVKISKTETYKYERKLLEYLESGGYPEYVLEPNPEYFVDLIESIIFKDIVYLHKIKNPEIVRDLLLLLADRCGHQSSFTRLAKILNVTVDTTREYVSYLKESFIVDEIQRYSTSRSKRIYAAKKFYIHDNGLLFHLSGRLNQGVAAERTLFKFLDEKYQAVNFYYEDKFEIDFIVDSQRRNCFFESKFNGEFKKDRLVKITKELEIRKGFMITKSEEGTARLSHLTVQSIPLWKWLLQ